MVSDGRGAEVEERVLTAEKRQFLFGTSPLLSRALWWSRVLVMEMEHGRVMEVDHVDGDDDEEEEKVVTGKTDAIYAASFRARTRSLQCPV